MYQGMDRNCLSLKCMRPWSGDGDGRGQERVRGARGSALVILY